MTHEASGHLGAKPRIMDHVFLSIMLNAQKALVGDYWTEFF